jgi:hypothetical protein
MQFEVYPVEGSSQSKQGRRPSEVARDIQEIYESVAAKTGSIIASHTLGVGRNEFVNPENAASQAAGVLYLVAQLPDSSSEFQAA